MALDPLRPGRPGVIQRAASARIANRGVPGSTPSAPFRSARPPAAVPTMKMPRVQNEVRGPGVKGFEQRRRAQSI